MRNRPIVERVAGERNRGNAHVERVRRATTTRPCTCANSKDYLHYCLSLERASNDLHEAPPRGASKRIRTRTHREQPPCHPTRQSRRRLVRVRARRDATAGRVAAGAWPLRLRGTIPSGRQPRLNDVLSHSDLQRPGFRKGSGPFRLIFPLSLRVCPCTPSSHNTRGVRGAGCARQET